MADTFKLKIVTPSKVYDNYEVCKLIVVTDNGEVTILPNHFEYLANVEISILKIFTITNEVKEIAVGGGAIHFDGKQNSVTLILNCFFFKEDVDVNKFKEKEKALREEMNNLKSLEEQKKAEQNLKQIINQLALKK